MEARPDAVLGERAAELAFQTSDVGAIHPAAHEL
jgi:hypothetical protein